MRNDYDIREDLSNEFEDLIEFSNNAIEKSQLDDKVIEIFYKALEKLKMLNQSLDEPFTIAVVGAQGVGKSTIINL